MTGEKQEVDAVKVEEVKPKTSRTRAKPKAAAVEAPKAEEKPAEAPKAEAVETPKPKAKTVEAPKADKPKKQDQNQLTVTNNGLATFCRVSGKTIASGQTVTITYKNTSLKAKAKRNFEQLNELAGKKRFVLEG